MATEVAVNKLEMKLAGDRDSPAQYLTVLATSQFVNIILVGFLGHDSSIFPTALTRRDFLNFEFCVVCHSNRQSALALSATPA